jgi:phosphatidylserine/phosphatidylglycerophosphate/cardiolipin synthase-like enzyme
MVVDNWTYARNQIIQSIPQPQVRLQIGQLLDLWHRESPELTAQSIALVLLAAAQAAEQRRRAETTSLVWTGPTREGPALRRTDQALLQVINAAQQRLLVVSFAVYKIANIRQALVKAAERGVHIKICVEAPEPSEGKMTYDTIKALGQQVARNATVYIWPKEKRPQDVDGKCGSLHVKCAVADEQLLFISSANLTEYALTLNMELGVLIQGGPLPGNVAAHFNRLIEDGVLVSIEA